ncbi:MAG TPA: polyprenyl synthetase family protein [Acidimicrobiia bacterium]|nr:polyprenyl synthetase family protein [Acidimicrobiia bacterium]
MEVSLSRPVVALPTGLAEIGARVEQRIDVLLTAEVERWAAVAPELAAPLGALRALVAHGGKRLRPAFCFWAWVGAGGDPDDPVITDVGAAIELLHAFALVHDDVMDGSAVRRGDPTVHEAFAADHRVRAGRGEARRFGEGAAILVGDFAFVYADRLMAAAPDAVLPLYDELRIELCVGQYLDLVGSAHGARDRSQAELIERYKSGKYTVERPLHIGAALAGRFEALAEPFSAFGVPLGEAFQMRDDLLGVFGDPEVTGKPVGDDLREGKLTPLVAAAVALAGPEHGDALARVGDPGLDADGVAAVQAALVATGAVAEVEDAIATRVDAALTVLATMAITEPARAALSDLARFVAWRDR